MLSRHYMLYSLSRKYSNKMIYLFYFFLVSKSRVSCQSPIFFPSFLLHRPSIFQSKFCVFLSRQSFLLVEQHTSLSTGFFKGPGTAPKLLNYGEGRERFFILSTWSIHSYLSFYALVPTLTQIQMFIVVWTVSSFSMSLPYHLVSVIANQPR